MKASELIKQLQRLMTEYGDLPVEIPRYDDIEYQDAEETLYYAYNLGGELEYKAIQIRP